jgi:hypothetical protein
MGRGGGGEAGRWACHLRCRWGTQSRALIGTGSGPCCMEVREDEPARGHLFHPRGDAIGSPSAVCDPSSAWWVGVSYGEARVVVRVSHARLQRVARRWLGRRNRQAPGEAIRSASLTTTDCITSVTITMARSLS